MESKLLYQSSTRISVNMWSNSYIGNQLSCITMGQYGDSGEDISINMDRFSENFRVNMDQGPKARGPY